MAFTVYFPDCPCCNIYNVDVPCCDVPVPSTLYVTLTYTSPECPHSIPPGTYACVWNGLVWRYEDVGQFVEIEVRCNVETMGWILWLSYTWDTEEEQGNDNHEREMTVESCDPLHLTTLDESSVGNCGFPDGQFTSVVTE